MIQRIAVVLDGHADPEQITPYLSGIVRPGLMIDFLIPAKARQAVWLMARTTALSTHNSPTVAIFQQRWGLELEAEKLVAERKLAPLSDSLSNQGAATAVRLYSGSLKKTLAQLPLNHPESLMVMRPEKNWLLRRALRTLLTRIGLSSSFPTSKVSLTLQTRQ